MDGVWESGDLTQVNVTKEAGCTDAATTEAVPQWWRGESTGGFRSPWMERGLGTLSYLAMGQLAETSAL